MISRARPLGNKFPALSKRGANEAPRAGDAGTWRECLYLAITPRNVPSGGTGLMAPAPHRGRTDGHCVPPSLPLSGGTLTFPPARLSHKVSLGMGDSSLRCSGPDLQLCLSVPFLLGLPHPAMASPPRRPPRPAVRLTGFIGRRVAASCRPSLPRTGQQDSKKPAQVTWRDWGSSPERPGERDGPCPLGFGVGGVTPSE